MKTKQEKDLREIMGNFGFAFEVLKALFHAVLKKDGTVEDLRRLLKEPSLMANIADLIVERPKAEEQMEYFTPILDADVPEQHKVTLAKYRKLASEHGVPATTSVCYRVKAGFTLKTHAPKAGPCHENYKYLQDWNFKDEATTECLVFWVPCILSGSTGKTKDEQLKLLNETCVQLELPTNHMSGFGTVALVAGLILAQHKATKERIPLNNQYVRTDSCRAGGNRLYLGVFVGAGLFCHDWLDHDAHGLLGAFALGVELGS